MRKRYTTLIERQFTLFDFMQDSIWVMKDVNVTLVKRCNFDNDVPLTLCTFAWSSTVFLLFKRCCLNSRKNVFQTLALLNPIIVTLLKTYPYSLPGAGSKCISDRITLSFRNTGCDAMSKTRLLSFLYALVCLKVWIYVGYSTRNKNWFFVKPLNYVFVKYITVTMYSSFLGYSHHTIFWKTLIFFLAVMAIVIQDG